MSALASINYIGITAPTQSDALRKARALGVVTSHCEAPIHHPSGFHPTHIFAVVHYGDAARFSRPIAAQDYVASAALHSEIRFY